MFAQFLEAAKTQVNESWKIGDAPKFISQFTYLRGAKYSFKDHEFQETILSDEARVVNTQKCSQIGMSEATARWGVAVCNMIPDFSVITTFPFSGDASDFARTRIDPFIASSPKLRENVNPKLNNGDIKQFLSSFMYFRGTNGKTQAISIPADCIISDEIDRSDPHVLSQYQSRLTHSSWKLRRNFSTPTIPGFGIALEMASSMRYKNVCKCNHCARWFLPNYFDHVKIPDFDNSLRAISKANLHKVRYAEAVLLCPHCGAEPDMGPEHREYVIENTLDNHEAHGYYVSPFDAPKIITPVDLIKSSTSYARYSEFVNGSPDPCGPEQGVPG
jgi:phage terminase large subunit GpA-like protein